MALALLFSKIENITHCSQSLFADDYLSFMNYRYEKIYPLNIVKNNNLNQNKPKFKFYTQVL